MVRDTLPRNNVWLDVHEVVGVSLLYNRHNSRRDEIDGAIYRRVKGVDGEYVGDILTELFIFKFPLHNAAHG